MKRSRLQVAALRSELAGSMPRGLNQATHWPASTEPLLKHSAHVSRDLYGLHTLVSLQAVALCNELVGRVPCGTRQPVRANLRPVSLTTPAGRLDWDPAGEVSAVRLASVVSQSLHAELCSASRAEPCTIMCNAKQLAHFHIRLQPRAQ